MNQIQLTLVLSYVLMSCYFFSNWLKFSLQHPSSSPEEKFLSFVMFLITTIFWPLTILMTLLEILQKRNLELSHVILIIVTIFSLSVSYYLSYLFSA